MNLPERDKHGHSIKYLKARLAVCFGGRVAEELIFGKDNITSGASNDILQATQKARAMVVEWGMSDLLGPLRYSENEEDVFLGRSVTQRKSMSDETAKLIDNEIRNLIDHAENHARKVLRKNMKHLHSLAKCLLEYETLSGDDVKQLIKKGKIENNDKFYDKNSPYDFGIMDEMIKVKVYPKEDSGHFVIKSIVNRSIYAKANIINKTPSLNEKFWEIVEKIIYNFVFFFLPVLAGIYFSNSYLEEKIKRLEG